MADKLTPQQHQAVFDRGGNLLVSAAAGSGKTKVLVDRLLSFLLDEKEPANIDDFLIITYTKAAAAELREKIANKLTEKIAEDPSNHHLHRQLQRLYLTTISTVHSFCADILRQYAYMLDIPSDFSVIDERDAVQLQTIALDQVLEDAYSRKTPDPDFLAFVESQGFHRNDRSIPQLILDVSTKALCHLQPNVWMDECISSAQIHGISDASQTPWGKFLIEDLKNAVTLEANTLQRVVGEIGGDPAFSKPAALLSDIVYQLQRLLAASTWDQVMDAASIDYGTLSFSKEARGSELAEQIKTIKAACKKHLDGKLEVFVNRNDQVMQDLHNSAAAVRGLIGLVRSYHKSYGKMKRGIRALDFSDLEHFTLDLLYGKSRSGITAAANEIAQRYRQIMVDEYQDSNEIQDGIFCALSQKKNNLFLVGDVKQSIYQFRLADPSIFLDKYNRFQMAGDASEGDGRKVLLSRNFRSGGAVLETVNDVFRSCMTCQVGGLDYGDDEALVEGIPHIDLPEPEIRLLGMQTKDESNFHEAQIVAGEIQKLLNEAHYVRDGESLRRIRPEDIVILLRSPGTQGAEYKAALESLNIPCADDLETNLFDAEEICVIRSLLSVISNPRQDIPLIATLASPVFGFSANDLAELRGGDRRKPIYELLEHSENEKSIRFRSVLARLRSDARVSSVAGLLERIYLHTGLDSIYGAMEDAPIRLQNLESFYSLAVEHDGRNKGNLEQFLLNLEIMEEKGLSVQGSQPTNCVRILSIHKSKGLEYPVVFLCSLSKRFNTQSMAQKVLLDKELGIGLCCTDHKSRICYPNIGKSAIAAKMRRELLSEEMRILYVAMTRPKDRLIMTFSFWKPESAFGDMAKQMVYSEPVLLHSTARSLASWVLYCALQRTEAGALFALGGRPNRTILSNTVWDIQILFPKEQEPVSLPVAKKPDTGKDINMEAIRKALSFSYPYQSAIVTPSKQTATQLKERSIDSEVRENAQLSSRMPVWRTPSFICAPISSADRGNAIHAAMQYIDFHRCNDLENLNSDLNRLVDAALITSQQRELIQPERILNFFASELGQKVLHGEKILREFKFSVLVDSEKSGFGEDKILLQGVVDCAVVSQSGIIVVDFKSDRVTQENVLARNQQYAPQIDAYAQALSHIFGLPVNEKWLYYFALDQGIML